MVPTLNFWLPRRSELEAFSGEKGHFWHILCFISSCQMNFKTFIRKAVARIKREHHLMVFKAKSLLFRDTTNGEFGTVWSLVKNARAKVCVDVGANDGFGGSMSFPFVARGWQALLVEPHPKAFARLQQLHAGNSNCKLFNCACADFSGESTLFEGTAGTTGCSTICRENNQWLIEARSNVTFQVKVQTLKEILDSNAVQSDFAVLSIDAEHMDYEVLLGLDLENSYRPVVVITEDSGYDKDKLKYAFLEKQGYRLIKKVHCNSIWCDTRVKQTAKSRDEAAPIFNPSRDPVRVLGAQPQYQHFKGPDKLP